MNDIEKLFDSMNTEKIRYVLLHGYNEAFFCNKYGDVDILVEKKDFNRVKNILLHQGWKKERVRMGKYKRYFFKHSENEILLDLSTEIFFSRKVIAFKLYEEFFTNDCFFKNAKIATPEVAMTYYIARIAIEKNRYMDKDKERIRSLLEQLEFHNQENENNHLHQVVRKLIKPIAEELMDCETNIEAAGEIFVKYTKLLSDLKLIQYSRKRYIYSELSFFWNRCRYKILRICKIDNFR